MATQPVFSSSSTSSPYDVFLSFRGEDTRTNFTNHLHNALVGKGIHTFIDDDELPRGEEIAPALLKAIEDSRISLIVFSENYASSRWCLDELVEILRCKQSKQQIVWPIFYKVDPSHVRNQTNKFGDTFNGLIERKFKDNEKKVLIWKEALTEAANLSGHPFKDGEYEVTFINKIVDGILIQVLSRTYLNVAKYPVGIPSRVQDVERLLDVGGNGRRMVGIWGASGIGKTTIAKAIWNEIAHKFEGSCFLANVRENSMPHGGLIQLQETLLDKILGKNLKIGNVDEGIGVIMERLKHKKILLILDDVDELEQLDNLAGDDWFGEGSRVIITTKDRGLLENHGIELIYKVKKLDYNQALELFSLNAFGINEPPNDYLELAQRAIAFADGLPLALTILGSHLRNRGIRRWQVILDDYKGEPYTHIERILQKSYDALDDNIKGVFLDIACFFKGDDKDDVLQIVSSKNSVPKDCIELLVEKAMITIEWNMILMHDLLAKLGQEIVRKESPNDPGQRSRLWLYEDVEHVLTECIGTRNIKGIMLKLPKPAEIILNPECFRNMVNLQIFINHNAFLCGDINYLPNTLRFIHWDGYRLQSLPPNFQGNRLVGFNMLRSHIKQLEGFKHLPNLTFMNLKDCQFLEKIPDLSGIPNIKDLRLDNCTSLVEVDDSVGFLDKLFVLHLVGCVKLTRFGTTLRLKSLHALVVLGCERLESFPEIGVEMGSVQILRLEGNGIRELPLSVANLTQLVFLDLGGSFNLTRFQSWWMIQSWWSTLRELDISGNNFVTLPECMSKFVNLTDLTMRDCKSLLEIPQEVLPPRVELLFLDNCTSMEKIPKLPLLSEFKFHPLSLVNCVRLRSSDITENYFLDQVYSPPHLEFEIILPGDELPKWFRCCEDVTPVKYWHKLRYARCESCFEIPTNLDWEKLRLVLCVVNKGKSRVKINGKLVHSTEFNFRMAEETRVVKETHMALKCIPVLNLSKLRGVNEGDPRVPINGEEMTRLQQGNMYQIKFEFYNVTAPDKIFCGVHLLGHQVANVTVDSRQRQWMAVDEDHDDDYDDDDFDVVVDDDDDDQHQDNELPSLPSASETSLGKRPRGSDFMILDDDHRANVVDVGDHEAQRGEADHPKRRHTDLNEEPKYVNPLNVE